MASVLYTLCDAWPSVRPRLAIRSFRLRYNRRLRSARSCRWNSSQSSPASESSDKKPFYITTPIFYVNACMATYLIRAVWCQHSDSRTAPHIGHLYSMVLADVLKRWQEMNGRQAFLSTGTDEHGTKVQRAAEESELAPKELCDLNSGQFRSLAGAGGITHDFFIRTTDKEHKETVKTVWMKLKHRLAKNLRLYKGTHKGWYCVSDECFYPDELTSPTVEPQTGRKIRLNVITGNEVEWVEEETWFFPLTKYKEALLSFYDANPHWITPQNRMNEVRNWVENQLQDLSVTRPISRLTWGITEPEDHGQTIYVWVDALINYLTMVGYGTKWNSAQDDMGLWPPDLHVIGKDILRFHAIYWPALLMALELPLPKKILCHNHWTMSDRKMSKSLGNVVSPFLAIERWDIGPLRYFLMRNGSLTQDMGYSNLTIGAMYTKELQANLGNLFYRIARPKVTDAWSTKEAVTTYRDGCFQEMSEFQDPDSAFETALARAPLEFSCQMNKCNTSGAIREVFELLRETNRYVTDSRPWARVKDKRAGGRLLLNCIIFNAAEALRIAGILLQPIMPTKASHVLDGLGVSKRNRSFEFAKKGKDREYGTEADADGNGRRRKNWDTIFPPVLSSDVSEKQRKKTLQMLFQSKTNNHMNQMTELLAMEARLGESETAKLLADKKNTKP